MLDEPRVVWRGTGDARGRVKLAYQTAAELTGYVITIDPARRLTLSGTIVASNPFLLTQTPLVFVVGTKVGACRWPVQTVTVRDDRLTAALGPLLERE